MRFVHGSDGFDGFHFDDDLSLDEQVDPISLIQMDFFVDEREGLLPLVGEPTLCQFVGETGLIGRFEQAWPQVPVYVDRCADDLAGELVQSGAIVRDSSQRVSPWCTLYGTLCSPYPFNCFRLCVLGPDLKGVRSTTYTEFHREGTEFHRERLEQ